jgi:predicted nucleic acid-binding protein
LKKAYLDANILLALAAGEKKEGRQYKAAVNIFDEIRDGKFVAVISSLTLMEVLAVFRTQKGREQSALNGLESKKQLEYVINESKTMYEVLIGQLLRLPNVKFDAGKHTDLNKLMDRALEILQKTSGKVRFFNTCKRCGSENVNYSFYKGMGSDDIIHALLARDLDCEYFITFDRDFEVLQDLEELEPLEFRVIKWMP